MLRVVVSHVGGNLGNQRLRIAHHSPCAGAGGMVQVEVAIAGVSAGAR